MNNSTNFTFPTPFYINDEYIKLSLRLYYSYCAVCSFYILVGTPLCVWFVTAILTSPDMRRRLRNQLVCVITLSYMLKSTVTGAIEMALLVAAAEGTLGHNCYAFSAFKNLRIVFEFAGSWLVISLLLVYLAQIFDYDPTSTLTPLAVNIGKGALLVLPFLLAVILVPSIGMLFRINFAKRNPGCILFGEEGYLVLRSLDYLVPVVISVILLIIAAALYYRRFHRGLSTSRAMQAEMMSRGPRIDNVVAYLVVISIDIACRLPQALELVELRMDYMQSLAYAYVSWMIMDARSVFMPWGWLLLEDIRERIKIWRPWYRPAPGIDLTVAYSRKENAGD